MWVGGRGESGGGWWCVAGGRGSERLALCFSIKTQKVITHAAQREPVWAFIIHSKQDLEHDAAVSVSSSISLFVKALWKPTTVTVLAPRSSAEATTYHVPRKAGAEGWRLLAAKCAVISSREIRQCCPRISLSGLKRKESIRNGPLKALD